MHPSMLPDSFHCPFAFRVEPVGLLSCIKQMLPDDLLAVAIKDFSESCRVLCFPIVPVRRLAFRAA